MGRTIGLIACSKKKNPEAEAHKNRLFPAQDMYKGNIFLKSREYAETHCDDWFILSGKYGLLEKNEEICYYNSYLKDKHAAERRKWCTDILAALEQKGFNLKEDYFIILGGFPYYEYLQKHLNGHAFKCYSGGIYLDTIKPFSKGGK